MIICYQNKGKREIPKKIHKMHNHHRPPPEFLSSMTPILLSCIRENKLEESNE
ncbi:hypothetical protein HYC85_005595 [Camellia sinensis]|uniref:Uncharacterized protein n=1 Tax=Camellia sinensis TaxID=4442 RepID=A0A7J7HZY7_CAMSI|nr:hypothetical protein HYC85_005595 [Camellia sinensis]